MSNVGKLHSPVGKFTSNNPKHFNYATAANIFLISTIQTTIQTNVSQIEDFYSLSYTSSILFVWGES